MWLDDEPNAFRRSPYVGSVKTRLGQVRGSVANGVHIFKGIPYAAPPFGANRLRPPQPVEPWSDV
jgi:carboxylesterase type B